MSYILDVVSEELRRSFLGKPDRRTQFNTARVEKELIPRVVTDLGNNHSFHHIWIEIFTLYPDQEALRSTQRIFHRLGRHIPERLRPNPDSVQQL